MNLDNKRMHIILLQKKKKEDAYHLKKKTLIPPPHVRAFLFFCFIIKTKRCCREKHRMQINGGGPVTSYGAPGLIERKQGLVWKLEKVKLKIYRYK